MKQLSNCARFYVSVTVIAGVCAIAFAAFQWHPSQMFRFLLYLTVALLASGLRVSLPGISGGMSINFVFILIATIDLNLPQVVSLGLAGTLGQFILRRKTWHPVQLAFNLSAVSLATCAAYSVYHSTALRSINGSVPILLFCAAAVLFAINTGSVSGIIALTEKKPVFNVWNENFLWTASHHLVGAAVAAVVHLENTYLGWEAAVLTFPVVYFVYRSYSLHLGRLHEAKEHAREMGDLHWRAIEALALAIDAKDETTHNHLLRVKVYATEIGKELGVSDIEMQALQAAALLHDIGKLAVPEYIISKPGKLTPEEFEKMKVHPVVGAEILERVRFPYPVVPIVRSHHEKWNGKGYPEGLKGEAIPLGARILAAVDCLDALASDRQYRRALPLNKAMEIVASESGTSFDPQVVEILQRRYVELEKIATSLPQAEEARLSKNVKFELGEAPAAGFEQSETVNLAHETSHNHVSVAAARHEFQELLHWTGDLGSSLTLEETLSLLASRLNRIVPHDTFVIYLSENRMLKPKFVSGEEARRFSALQIPVGEGISGWVVENHTTIINGNPAVEPGYDGAIRAALSIPLTANEQVIGALTLYSATPDFFTKEHLRTLLAICPTVGLTVANSIFHQRTLPPARVFFERFAAELEAARGDGSDLAIMLIESNPSAANRLLQLLKLRCRDTDYVALLNHTDLVVILPGLTGLAAKRRVDQLRKTAADSLGIGVAFFPADGNDEEELMKKAEQRKKLEADFAALPDQTRPALALIQ